MYARTDHESRSSSPVHPSRAIARPALVGRDEALGELVRRLVTPGYGGAAVTGGPGTGKSRLLTEAATAAEELGYRLIRVQCTPSSKRISLQAVASAFRTAGLPTPEDVDDAVAVLVAAGHRNRVRILLCVDDAHLADTATAELLLRVVRDRACGVLMAVSDTPLASPEIHALWTNEWIPRTVLPRLSQEEVEQVCLGFLPGLVGVGVAERYAVLCDGDLLLLQELLADAIETGALRTVDDVWSDAEASFASDRLVPLVASKLRQLDTDHQTALEAVGVAEVLPLSVARDIAPAEIWETLEGRRLVEVVPAPEEMGLTLQDNVVRRFLLSRLPVLRRRRLLTTLVTAFEANGAWSRANTIHRALWNRELGTPLTAGELEVAAAEAWWAQDWRTAAQLALSARDMDRSGASETLLTRVQQFQGSCAQPGAARGPVPLGRVPEPGTPSTGAGSHRVPDDRERLHQNASAPRPQGGGAEAKVLAAVGLGQRFLDADQPRLAWQTVKPHVLVPDPSLRLGVATVAVPSLLRIGRVHDCLALAPHWEHAIDELRSHGVPEYDPFSVRTQLAYARGLAGDPEEAIDELSADLRRAASQNNSQLSGAAAVHLARLLFTQGQVRRAYRLFAAVNEKDVTESTYRLAVSGAVVCAVHLDDARAVERATSRLAALRLGPLRPVETDIASAVIEAHEGRKTNAVQILQVAADELLEAGALGQLSEVVHLLTRFDRAKLADGYRADAITSLQGGLPRASVQLAQATAARNPEGVSQCAQFFESAGAPLYAAEAWAIAFRLHRQAGQPRLATAAARRCETAREGYDGANPPLLHLMGETELLSGREREIALLAAQRHTSQEIADRLVISVRTVDNHLYRIYRKLGVSSRQQLRLALASV
ncbi:LuxR C-terminal-related transcriptional regulator [Streptomyces sp. NPDC057675]|uniref:LuxR C-terminal-related transcriptional regulator n=1 Tax=Streptomyces sp. NPDC057675 TaxID=3346204 RepID=UPI0036A94413